FRTDHSRLDEAADIGVVAGDPRNLPVADQVEPGVADVHVVERVVSSKIALQGVPGTILSAVRRAERASNDRRRRAGGSHAAQFGMGKAVFPDLFVSCLQGLVQGGLRVVA